MNKITGPVYSWKLLGNNRTYSTLTLPYEEAVKNFVAVRYDATKNKGEQRELVETHVRKLRKEMVEGSYTPVPISVNIPKKKVSDVKYRNKDGVKHFSIELNDGEYLSQTDGGHRFAALERILSSLNEKLTKTEDEVERKTLKEQINEVLELPITATIYLDGDPQQDFINLQAGRSVDAAHLLSLRIQRKVLDQPEYKLGFDVAKALAGKEGSPFHGHIRFDSRGVAPLPISSLCSKSSSDITTSFLGLAKVGLLFDSKITAEKLADLVTEAYEIIKTKAPEVLEYGKVLTTVGNNGTRGSASMMIGVGICYSYLAMTLKDVKKAKLKLLDSIQELNKPVNGNFSGPFKRTLLGKFASKLFSDLTEDKHEEIPLKLVKTLSASAFGIESLPKPVKETKTKTKKTEVETVVTEPTAGPGLFDSVDTEVEKINEVSEETAPWTDEMVKSLESEESNETTKDPWENVEDTEEVQA